VLKKLMGRVYSVGIYAGPSPLALAPAPGARNPVLTRASVTDRLSAFVADPFMVRTEAGWSMFFESKDCGPGWRKGEIGLATSRDGLRWEYQGIVVSEPFHLSYPQVFAWRSEHYMIPESGAAGWVRLYRACPFPYRWEVVASLVPGAHVDSSVFRHDGRWWMLTHREEGGGVLRLFHADELAGPWREHPLSPVVRADPRIARPAGRVIMADGRLMRFAQDCSTTYGGSVNALEITRLSEREFEERVIGSPVLAGDGRGWNALGMHHVDAHQLEDGSWLACVDGWANTVRRPREFLTSAANRWRERLAS
jgi:hypothetical protein